MTLARGQTIKKFCRRHISTAPKEAADHGSTSGLWKKFTLFGVIPILVACHYQAGLIPGSSDLDHSKRPPFVKYEHLRVRTKVNICT